MISRNSIRERATTVHGFLDPADVLAAQERAFQCCSQRPPSDDAPNGDIAQCMNANNCLPIRGVADLLSKNEITPKEFVAYGTLLADYT